MTDLAEIIAHRERCAKITKDYWRQYESYSEHAERVEWAEQRAGWYFAQATVAQQAAYDRAMADAAGLYAPRYDRAREAAKRAWYSSTAEARTLYERTLDDFMRDSEISEETGALWDALAQVAKQEAA